MDNSFPGKTEEDEARGTTSSSKQVAGVRGSVMSDSLRPHGL